MTGSSTPDSTDVDAGHHPEPVGDHEEPEVRQVAPDREEPEIDEAGYGYGV